MEFNDKNIKKVSETLKGKTLVKFFQKEIRADDFIHFVFDDGTKLIIEYENIYKLCLLEKEQKSMDLSENEREALKVLDLLKEHNINLVTLKYIYSDIKGSFPELTDLECGNIGRCSVFNYEMARKYFDKPEKEKEPLPADLLTVWNLLHEANGSGNYEREEILTAQAKRNVNEFYKSDVEEPKEKIPSQKHFERVWDLLRKASNVVSTNKEHEITLKAKSIVIGFYED